VGEVPDVVLPLELEVLVEGWPTLVWCPVEVTHPSGAIEHYQLVLALHRTASPEAEPSSFVGVVTAPTGTAHVYEALGDPLGSVLLGRAVAPDLKPETVEPVRRDGATSAVAFDDRWQLTLYRRLVEGPNPDVEIPTALGRAEVEVVAGPVAAWRRHEWDLASVRRLLPRAADGTELTRRSLAELCSRRCQPRETKADFRDDAELLGQALAHLHVGLAEAFGVGTATGPDLVDALVSHARRVAPRGVDLTRIEEAYRRLESSTDLGTSIRVHGDLRLGRVLRDRRNWVFVDFEGTPGVSLDERRRPTSPLRDVAAMVRSFHDAAELAVAERLALAPVEGDDEGGTLDRTADPELALLATAWEDRATRAFIGGYASVDAVHPLLPSSRTSRDALLTLFELSKAVEDVGWALARRPHVAGIAMRAVSRLLDPDLAERW
jgi:maltokinase